MALFEQMMKGVENKLVNQFTDTIKNLETKNGSITKKQFITTLLATNVGDYFATDILAFDDKTFYDFCHQIVDSTSLSGPEYDFFHKIIDLKVDASVFVENCILAYDETTNLSKCQLGSGIKRCLEFSKNIKMI